MYVYAHQIFIKILPEVTSPELLVPFPVPLLHRPRNRVAQQVVAAVGGRREPRRLDRIYVAPGGWQMDVRLVGTEAFYEELMGAVNQLKTVENC